MQAFLIFNVNSINLDWLYLIQRYRKGLRLHCVYDTITVLPYPYTTLPLSSEFYYNRYIATQHTYNSCLLMYFCICPACMLHTPTAKCLSILTPDSITCPLSFAFTLTHLVHSAEGPGDRTPLCQRMETKIEVDEVHLNLQKGKCSIGGIKLTNSQGVEQMQRRELVCASLWGVPSSHCTTFSPWGAWRTCPTQWPSWQWDVTLRLVRTKSAACSTLPQAQWSSPGPPSSGPAECHLGNLSSDSVHWQHFKLRASSHPCHVFHSLLH